MSGNVITLSLRLWFSVVSSDISSELPALSQALQSSCWAHCSYITGVYTWGSPSQNSLLCMASFLLATCECRKSVSFHFSPSFFNASFRSDMVDLWHVCHWVTCEGPLNDTQIWHIFMWIEWGCYSKVFLTHSTKISKFMYWKINCGLCLKWLLITTLTHTPSKLVRIIVQVWFKKY
jgi:hypothetical protein